jgi:hypothetical protein
MPTWKAYAKKDDITATKLDDLAAPDDNTDLNATNARHGLLLKLIDDTTKFLRSDGGWQVPAGGGPTIVRKTADETVNNSTVLQNDDHLLLAIAANEVWLVVFYLNLLQGNSTTPLYKFAVTVPDGATLIFGGPMETTTTGVANVTGTTTSGGALTQRTAANAIDALMLFAIVTNGATAGNIQLQWAQAITQAVDTKVLANSCLIAFKLA